MKIGFTLIELLVVVLIIAILAAIAVPQYQKAVTKSRMAQMRAMMEEVVRAGDLYYLRNGKYPTSFDDLEIDLPLKQIGTPSCGANLNNHKDALEGDGFEISLADVYLNKYNYVSAYFTTGKYKCRGWIYFFRYPEASQESVRHTFCAEHYYGRACGNGCEKGILCQNVMGKGALKFQQALVYMF